MDDVIEVSGTGTAAAPPDLVTIELRMQCHAATVAAALDELNSRLAATLAAAKAHQPAPVSITTTGLGVNQRHDRQGEIDGHTAYQTLRIRAGEPQRAGELIAGLGEQAGDSFGIDNLTLGIADPAPLLHQARAAAFAEARTRAEHYAALAGRSLARVLSVSDVPRAGPGPVGRAAFALASDSMPIEGGEQELSVGVTVRFELV